jgi:4-aminobutyrate aminotransferase-like enzyme
VARKVIDIIRRDGLIERGRQIAARLAEGLEGLRLQSGRLEDLRWRGPMMAVELCDDPQAGLTRRVHQALVRRGYIAAQRPGRNVLRLDPALTIEMRDIDGFLESLADILAHEG